MASIAGKWTIPLTPSLSLKSVLHVPKLSINLLSIHKLTKDLNCKVVFSPNDCVFQEPIMGKTIGLAKERDGLYFLDTSGGKDGSQLPLSHFSEKLSLNKSQIWLHHFRLGHPSFSVLKTMFPILFKGMDDKSFHCEVCQFAKHHRVSFPWSDNKSLHPFSLIHTDVWGPSKIPNITGARWFISFIDDCTRVTWLFLMKYKSDVSIILPKCQNDS